MVRSSKPFTYSPDEEPDQPDKNEDPINKSNNRQGLSDDEKSPTRNCIQLQSRVNKNEATEKTRASCDQMDSENAVVAENAENSL